MNCIQINLNGRRAAQDLLSQYIIERRVSIACVSEPGVVLLNNPFWQYSKNDMAAIYWVSELCKSPGIPSYIGRDFVATKFSDLCVVSVYVSLNASNNYFLEFLNELRNFCTTVYAPSW